MFSPNRNSPNRHQGGEPKEPKPMPRHFKLRLLATVVLTFVLLFLYYGCVAMGMAQAVMIAYFVVFAVLIITYLLYNRGFVNKDVTEDMLPSDWSEEKKQAFLEDNRRRAERSRWMMIVIIPFIIVFMCEALYLFVWDAYLANYFKG